MDESDDIVLSIGAVSRETGIPTGTLRTWERRYGFPDPDRDESGHRRYPRSIVDRLRLTNRAVEAGYRPSNVVGMTTADLRELLDASDLDGRAADSDGVDAAADADVDADREWLEEWLEASAALDGAALEEEFRRGWNELGPLRFVVDRAAPFLRAVGEEWARDNLKVVHEHYTSECLRDFLTSRWRPLSSRTLGERVLLAAPEGEQHALGLHLVATLFAITDWEILFLGPNTPVEEVVDGASADEVDAVGISISQSYRPGRGVEYLERLREELPDEVVLLAGGDGAPGRELDDGIERFDSLEDLYDWAFRTGRRGSAVQAG